MRLSFLFFTALSFLTSLTFALETKVLTDHRKLFNVEGVKISRKFIMSNCIRCHNKSKDHVREIIHWSWACDGKQMREKVLNSVNMVDESSCLECHGSFQDFKSVGGKSVMDENLMQVDCLICHDTSNIYSNILEDHRKKAAAMLFSKEELNKMLASIDRPSKTNCGNCHYSEKFFKQSDLFHFYSDAHNDVHMMNKGKQFQCTTCHTSFKHVVSENCEETSLGEKHHLVLKGEDIANKKIMYSACEACHSTTPHQSRKLNDHTGIVACQTCHNTAANRIELERNKNPNEIIGLEYNWYDGLKMDVVTNETDKEYPYIINKPIKDVSDRARIFPFKVTYAKNDEINPIYRNKLKRNELFKGQKKLPEINAKIFWPINHIVGPAKDALKCNECHDQNKTILKSVVNDVYMPGVVSSKLSFIYEYIDRVAFGIVILTFLGVCTHGLIRMTTVKLRRKNGKH